MSIRKKEKDTEQLSLLVETLPVVSYTCRPDGNFSATYVSDSVTTITGYKPDDFTSDPSFWADHIHPDDKPGIFENVPKFFENNCHQREYRLKIADGSYKWLNDMLRLVKLPDGTNSHIVGVFYDITKRKQIEEELCKSEQEMKIKNQISNIFLTVPNKKMYEEVLRITLEALESSYGLFGYIDQDDLSLVMPSMGNSLWNQCQVSGKDFKFPWKKWMGICGRALDEKRTIIANKTSHLPDGHVPVTRAISTPIIFHGNLTGVISAGNKTTDYGKQDQVILEAIASHIAPVLYARLQSDRYERKRRQVEKALKSRQHEIETLNASLERRIHEEVEKSWQKDVILMHQSRLAAMGEMIGLIAHQWRQPLNALNLLLYNIKDAFEDAELDEKTLNNFTKNGITLISKMSTTIDDFRSFFKPHKGKKKFRVNKIINDSLALIESSFKYNNISVTITGKEEVTSVGFPNEYSQVILNILNNARDATAAKKTNGKIMIDVFTKNDSAVVTVGDDGGGIPEKNLAVIFEPYFTTKEERKGTGLGLYLSKIIIEDHMNGAIEVKNIKGGTEFRITTPTCEPQP